MKSCGMFQEVKKATCMSKTGPMVNRDVRRTWALTSGYHGCSVDAGCDDETELYIGDLSPEDMPQHLHTGVTPPEDLETSGLAQGLTR